MEKLFSKLYVDIRFRTFLRLHPSPLQYINYSDYIPYKSGSEMYLQPKLESILFLADIVILRCQYLQPAQDNISSLR